MVRTRSRAVEVPICPLWEYNNKDEITGYGRVAPNEEQWTFISRPSRRRSLSPSSSTPSSLFSQRLKRSARRTVALMIKRMASKLHLGQSKHTNADTASTSSAASSYTVSSQSALSLSHEHRASISTQRTSLHEWVDSQKQAMQQDQPSTSEIQVRRAKGSYRLSDFIIQRTLGTGSFGRVHLVRSRHNMRFYAIKVLNKEKIVRMKQESHTRNEQAMLQAVQHPFIINLWGTFQDTANLYMVMDFVPGGELFTLLRRSNRFPDPVAKFYAAEVALALNYLHSKDIIYRDLKPENILLNFDGHIKIADFGFAKYCANTAWTLCGTPDYLAPEIIGNARYNKSVDWYALGVLIFEMLSGLPPFHEPDISPVVLYEKIAQGPSCIKWPAFHPNATDLILKFMERDPSKRFGNLQHGAGDVFAHPWFREVDWNKLLNREITAPYLPRIAGDGDASAFERYPEDNAAAQYGEATADPYGDRFPDFEYTSS